MESAGGYLGFQQNHLPPIGVGVGVRWERRNQPLGVRRSSKITYKLLEGDGRDSQVILPDIQQHHVHAVSGWVVGETESTGDSADIQQHHVHAVDGQWGRQSQPGRWGVHLSSKMTYILWAGDVDDGVSG
jgi:hypothetical protein